MEGNLQWFIVLLLAALCSAQNFREDPCEQDKHKVLNQTIRSTGYTTRTGDIPQCDDRLRRGWYKFIDVSGKYVDMPTTCPGTNTCGTATPIWIDGRLPTIAEGIVTRRLCGKRPQDASNGNCCGYEDEFFVKNCKDFYVYYLNPPNECAAAYCAGNTQRCPATKWSSTSYEPCRDIAPVLQTPPVIKGPNINAQTAVDVKCEITYDKSEPDQVFLVSWTFNNVADAAIPPQTLTGSQRVATLSGEQLLRHMDQDVRCSVATYYSSRTERNTYVSNVIYIGIKDIKLTGPHVVYVGQKFYFGCTVNYTSQDPNQRIEVIWTFNDVQDATVAPRFFIGNGNTTTIWGSSLKGHLNSELACQARLVYDGSTTKSVFRKSNTYYVGIRFNSTTLEIKDSDGEKSVTITSTIPVVCSSTRNCCLTFKLAVDNPTVVSLKDTCDQKLCYSDWEVDTTNRASKTVVLVPSRNAIGGATRTAVLSFAEIVIPDLDPFHRIFEDYKPANLQIGVKLEVGFTCSITGDPHVRGFDYQPIYDLYQAGDYTVYVVKDRDFLVQIRTYRCGNVACICGAVVKEKNDIIKVHGCGTTGGLMYSTTIQTPYNLSSGASVLRSSNAQHVGIKLSSGSEVRIDITYYHMDVYIQTPAYDKNKAVGMCGTNDGIPGNDFTYPNGTVTPTCTGPARCIPVQFTESWRVTGNSSMFVVTPAQVPEKPSEVFCSCRSTAGVGNSCSSREHIQDPGLACTGCQDITPSLKPNPWGQPGQAEKPYEHIPIPLVDPNQRWPNAQGVTEAQATNLCNQAIQKSPLFSKCSSLGTLVHDARTECLGDILNGGTTEFLDAITASFTSKCQILLSNDENNYKKNPDGSSTLKEEFCTGVCPTECLKHGTCGTDGKCQCQTGWEGPTCVIEKGKGPQIAYTPGSACPANQTPCDRVQFKKSNVNIFDKLKCRLQPVDSQGKKIGAPVISDAVGDPSTIVVCPLPQPGTSNNNYIVSVSTDGITYGNELPIQPVDDC